MITWEGARYRTATYINKLSEKILPKGYYNLGADKLPKNSKRALVIYTTHYLHYYLNSKKADESWVNSHSAWWESVAILHLLNEAGYIVDYLNVWLDLKNVNWGKYDLIIDERNNLKDCPLLKGQKKVFYATGCHWLYQNLGELNRINDFYNRHGILIESQRQLQPNFSDEYADIITFRGNNFQANSFNEKPLKHQINISSVYIPEYRQKDVTKSRNNFLWIGGAGFVHKGLDLVVDAFSRIPQANLYVVGKMESEPLFWNWMKPYLYKYQNIKSCGWLDVASPEFNALAENCISVVYPSASEGGAGSVNQALHFGLIPVVTKSTCLRAEKLGLIIDETSAEAIIESIVSQVNHLLDLQEEQLLEMSVNVQRFAQENHTREAFKNSFKKLLTLV